MKAKSIFLAVILLSAFVLKLSAQTVKTPEEKQPTKVIVVNAVNNAPVDSSTTIVFDKYKYDFGTIKESAGKVSTVFTFTNCGNSPVLISAVIASCGCTASDWTQEPVIPGGQGYIKATYDPANRIYFFNKELTVYSNANPSKIVLSIQGTAVKE